MECNHRRNSYTFKVVLCSILLYAMSLCASSVGGIIHSELTECLRTRPGELDKSQCEQRMVSKTKVLYGFKHYQYVLNYKEQPTKGLYIKITTARSSVAYHLIYHKDVPFNITEHTTIKNATDFRGSYFESCKEISMPQCDPKRQIPDYLKDSRTLYNAQCCICGHNAFGTIRRGPMTCGGKGIMMHTGAAISKSCLEFKHPWYSIYEPKYPPEEIHVLWGEIYEFDSLNGKILDFVEIDTKVAKMAANPEKPRDPIYKDGILKFTIDEARLNVHSVELDITITRTEVGRGQGAAPEQFNKYIAIPVYPSENPTVMGSSMVDKCLDPTWRYSASEECEKSESSKEFIGNLAGNQRECMLMRCTKNMITIDKSYVDVSGNSCDKIGYSTAAWHDQDRLCNSVTGSCLHNQLEWYLKTYPNALGLPKLYGVSPTLVVSKKSPRAKKLEKGSSYFLNRDQFAHQIIYQHDKDDYAELKFETKPAEITRIKNNAPGFIMSARVSGNCSRGSGKACWFTIHVCNTGLVDSNFYVRLECYPVGKEKEETSKNMVAFSEQSTLRVTKRKTRSIGVQLNTSKAEAQTPLYCNIRLYSSNHEELHKAVVPFTVGNVRPKGEDVRSEDPVSVKHPRTFESPTVVTNSHEHKRIDGLGDGTLSGGDGMCVCQWYNALCVFGNFKPCVIGFLKTTYIYISIAAGVLLLLCLSPLLIPLIRQFGVFIVSRIRATIRGCRRATSTRNDTIRLETEATL